MKSHYSDPLLILAARIYGAPGHLTADCLICGRTSRVIREMFEMQRYASAHVLQAHCKMTIVAGRNIYVAPADSPVPDGPAPEGSPNVSPVSSPGVSREGNLSTAMNRSTQRSSYYAQSVFPRSGKSRR